MPNSSDPSLSSPLKSVHRPTNKLVILRIFNILTFLSLFLSNAYFKVFASPNSGDISDKYPTHFAPSLTFVTVFWSILFFLQSGFVFYAQLNDASLVQEVVGKIVHWWFSLANLFMCARSFFWMQESFILSELFVLLALISASIAQHRLIVEYMSNHSLLPTSVILFVHVPTSMFSAFSWFALFHNGFIILSQNDYENVDFAVLSAAFLSVLSLLWCTTGIFSRRRRDLIFSLSVAWMLLGVGVQQDEIRLFITCYVLAFIQVAVILFITLYGSSKKPAERSETESLLQHRRHYYGGIPPIMDDNGVYNNNDERDERENLFQNRIKCYGGIIVDNWRRLE